MGIHGLASLFLETGQVVLRGRAMDAGRTDTCMGACIELGVLLGEDACIGDGN